jgi:hypothetical protein
MEMSQDLIYDLQDGRDGRIDEPEWQVHDGRNDQEQIQTIHEQTERPCVDLVKGQPPEAIIIVTIRIDGHGWWVVVGRPENLLT